MNNLRTSGSQVDPIQTSTFAAPRAPNRLVKTPLNIVEKIKNTNVSIPMWDVLAIPSQREFLKRELQDIKLQNEPSTSNNAANYIQPMKEEDTSKKIKPSPFCLFVMIGDKMVHNFMIDSGASSSIMPKCLAGQLGLKYEPMLKHVLQLDGTSITIVGVVKGLKIELHAFLGYTII